MLLQKKTKSKKNNKSKSKKQRTFTSSEYSLPDDRNQSLNELFRNDLLKRKTQTKNNKSQKQLCTTKKRTKSKSKLRLDKC
jgi:6-phosphogluconolactonase/glucosamine-6-phosphate isomerase/deaminase